MSWRYTVTEAGGSNVPYRGSTLRRRIQFEHFFAWLGNPNDERSYWRNLPVTEEKVRKVLKALDLGFTEHVYPVKGRTSEPGDYYATRLNYLKEIEPGIWEWETHSPYTD